MSDVNVTVSLVTLPANAVKAANLAEEHGWTVVSRGIYDPPSVALRFVHADTDVPRVAALWGDGHFTFALARNGFRLGYRDLLAVLADPGLLLDFDPEDPFDYEAKQAEKEAKVDA